MKTSNEIIKTALAEATNTALKDSPIPVPGNERKEIIDQVIDKVAPVVLNQTNNEPWYQSRVTIGALLAVLSGLLGAFGYALPDELRGQILEIVIAAGPVIGGAVALYGRWVAKKPIGS